MQGSKKVFQISNWCWFYLLNVIKTNLVLLKIRLE